jgi:SpoVK/Ycf46/Vps4 family AAA+-type ATPase
MKGSNRYQKINLINHIERISNKSAKSILNLEKLKDINKEITILADYLNITPIQAVMFASIFELSIIHRTNIGALSRHFKCSPLKMISMMDEIDALINKGLVRKSIMSRHDENTFNDIYFTVPNSIIEGIRKMDHSKLNKEVKFDIPKFLERVFKLSVECEDHLISTQQLIHETEELIRGNINLYFVKYVDTQLLEPINKCVVFTLTYAHLTGKAEVELGELVQGIFDDVSDQFTFRQNLLQGNHELITKEFVSIQHSEFREYKIINVTDKVLSNLFQQHTELRIQDFNSSILIKPGDIKYRQLFFNVVLQNDIDALRKTISNKKFNSIRRQLRQRKFNSGLTVLLYGHSGTGKTEVVYQLAKKTNREIMMVDLSETKSMYLGESEKQVKKIFDNYKLVIRNSKITPILFINEVDGLLSKRQNIGNNTTSAMYALNTMQNIILQEMESFDGILFATTNLNENLDKAFDRRFLFKLKFTHPDVDSRQKIWRNRLPDLSIKQSRLLSEKYELTGGQIENVIRQTLLEQMVNKLDLFDTLNKNCDQESGYSNTKRIGF